MHNNKTFCVLPFIHFEINTQGEYRPCCLYKDAALRDDGTQFNVTEDSIEDIRDSLWLAEVQRKMLSGEEDAGCFKCYNDERLGNTSRRLKENERFFSEIENINAGEYNIRIMDIKPGNVCNLKCRICNENSSSLWLSEKMNNKGLRIDDNKKRQYKWFENTTFWDDILEFIHDVTHIEIFGGEPMLMKQQFRFLEQLIDLGIAGNIELAYATNGTIYPENAIKNIFPHFKHVTFMVSADGIEDTFEYCRHPGKWSVFSENLDRLLQDDISVSICYSVSVYSIYNLPQALDYYMAKGVPVWLNTVYDREKNLTVLPAEIKREMTDYLLRRINREWDTILHEKSFQSYIEYMNSADGSAAWNDFVVMTRASDRYRKERVTDIVPMFKEYFDA